MTSYRNSSAHSTSTQTQLISLTVKHIVPTLLLNHNCGLDHRMCKYELVIIGRWPVFYHTSWPDYCNAQKSTRSHDICKYSLISEIYLLKTASTWQYHQCNMWNVTYNYDIQQLYCPVMLADDSLRNAIWSRRTHFNRKISPWSKEDRLDIPQMSNLRD